MTTTRKEPPSRNSQWIFHLLAENISASSESSAPDSSALEQGIQASVMYIRRALSQEGKFVYRIHADESPIAYPQYNIVRHAGVLYSLCLSQEAFPTLRLEKELHFAASFLKTQIAPAPSMPGSRALWSRPEVENSGAVVEDAKLGGTGLALVALASLEKLELGLDSSLLPELGNFLLHMQKPNGSFYARYMQREIQVLTPMCLYYPGEAALGLVLLFEIDGNPRWLNAARAALFYLARKDHGKSFSEVEHDHWALMAIARIWPHLKEETEKAILNEHSFRICTSIVRSQNEEGAPLPSGAFDSWGTLCPCATRLEGLLAILLSVPVNQDLKRQIVRACERGVHFLLRMQIKEGAFAGGFPQSALGHPDHARFRQKEETHNPSEVRIDYVQHALSALINYWKWLRVIG